MRIEKDKIGTIKLEEETLYGIQTARAIDNFALNCKKTNRQLIHAIVTVKKAAALSYKKLGIGKDGVYEAVIKACDIILSGKAEEAFVTEALQGGAGTSTNMNVNEVIANLSLHKLGFDYGRYDIIHPLDDVNRGQSTNDVYPTALRITAIHMLRKLSENCAKLQQALQNKEREYEDIHKLGRTELMDAVPITLGQEFGSYAQAIARDRWRLYKVEERLRQVNIGGTAVGVGNNAEKKYRFEVIEKLRELTGIGLASAEYPMDITQNNDVFIEVSGLIKALAVNLMKISNDLRLMNSGPIGGLSEITLMPLQLGSTIMPGKVNPIIPEMVMQVSMKVMGNDTAISMAASHGEFELNAFLPLIADSLLENLELLTNATELFRTKCIELIIPNKQRCKELLDQSYAFATAYTHSLGYDRVNDIIKESEGDIKKAKEILENAKKTEL
ncbi:aspartate ammonia-lyase [Mobilitalea sibirica]|uniref:Aspartate ammonia-lyase n=1 Tax=Mobilitalea sibirica TaxID=1462919 RepID=A0A8J7KWC8_9FIRM|nr:aspartate ammonia-lyase [Mobilitalea sibirica]MBH1941215.1 aspartate ammonia-lyase [Mobilitalea sibirica]